LITFIAKLLGRSIAIKFYLDNPPLLWPSYELVRVFFPILVYLHIVALAVDSILFKLRRESFIDHEGFVFKQISDLYYLAWKFDLLNKSSFRFFVRLALGIISSLNFIAVIFHVSNYGVLVNRYIKQRSREVWRKVEPVDYVMLQQAIYRVIARGCVIDASRGLREVPLDATKCLVMQL